MIDKHDKLYKDLEAVHQIAIVPTLLDIVCRLTGLGFAAVARVTEDRWLACSVRDEVNFGLVEGSELEIKTTICNEIRDHHKEVVIDHVDKDERYKDHHTPKIYGLQSYISFPIMLKNGEFFGTLCAIGTKPANLSDLKVTGTFKMFAELISFHLQSIDLMEQSRLALAETKTSLRYLNHENLLYQQISDHNLQEPLRKISIFSDLLVNHTENSDVEKAKKMAAQISSFASELNSTIQNVTKFSTLKTWGSSFKPVELNDALTVAENEFKSSLAEKNITINREKLPLISASEEQMEQVFSQLIEHAITFSRTDVPSTIKISSKKLSRKEIKSTIPFLNSSDYYEISVTMTEMATDKYSPENIFDILIHLNDHESNEKYGTGLANCRKIIFNHGGTINAQTKGSTLTLTILLPALEMESEVSHLKI